ncbi:hypothetical protein G6F56_008298 [Rhizopus delemar]|nr:hypothetical protein G6F56_008298 [Rhizopus delemar]
MSDNHSDQELNALKNNESVENVTKEQTTESDTESIQDAEAFRTIMEYNRKLLQRIQELEKNNKDLKEKSVTPKKDEEKKGTNQTFEFPIGEMLESYGSLNTSEPPEEEEEATAENNREEETESGKIRISDGDKDDIVVKVDATRKGITLTLHIPRN